MFATNIVIVLCR